MATKRDENIGRIGTWKAISLLLSFFVAILSSLVGWLCVGHIDHAVRLTKIEANVVTSREVNGIMLKVNRDLADLIVRVEKLPDEFPPKWFERMVREDHEEIRRLKERR